MDTPETRVALITGAGRGIGRSIAESFAANGYAVAVNDLPDVGVDDTLDSISKQGGRAHPVIYDIGREEHVEEMFEDVHRSLGLVDVLVNNAAFFEFVNPSVQTVEGFSRTLQVDVVGAFMTTRAAARDMSERSGGVVINIASVNGYVTIPQNAAYAAAKAALIGLTRGFALDLGPRGIRVVSISPGFTETPAVKMYLDALSDEARDSEMRDYYERVPLGRLARPQEIADACIFLASERATFITGTDFLVDGGMYALNRAFSYNP
jgi:NAD(P)-dependent dehydrogenase (short-subunit alcohol dehydrogenase family)